MAADYINFDTVMERDLLSNFFMDTYASDIFELHKKCHQQEQIRGYSYIQYDILNYNMAFEYCIRILFEVLTNITDRDDKDEELEIETNIKKKYNYKDVESNLAHVGIRLDDFYSSIKSNYLQIIQDRQSNE